MSRIGKKPILIPAGVSVAVDGGAVRVKGPLGEIDRALHPAIGAELADNRLVVKPLRTGIGTDALWGLERSLLANMVEGVSKGFAKELEIIGVGYKAEMQGANLKLALGFSHPVIFQPPATIKIETPSAQMVVVKGCDKQLVGLVADKIRSFRPPEPYKGKGIRYRGEKVRRKVRKGAVAGAKG